MAKHYSDFAKQRGITLQTEGPCQFCGAPVSEGVHECMSIFAFGFQDLGLNEPTHHAYRFLIVDAHALQHPELHGQWSDVFHLTRLAVVLGRGRKWCYEASPVLSRVLDGRKDTLQSAIYCPPAGARGLTMRSVQQADDPLVAIVNWARSVRAARQTAWADVEPIADAFEEVMHLPNWDIHKHTDCAKL